MKQDDEAWYFNEGNVLRLLLVNGSGALLSLLAVAFGFTAEWPLRWLQGLTVIVLLTHFLSYALCPLHDIRLLLRLAIVISAIAGVLLLRFDFPAQVTVEQANPAVGQAIEAWEMVRVTA